MEAIQAPSLRRAIAALVQREEAARDALLAARLNWGFEPKDRSQEQMLPAFRRERRVAVRSGHGVGKTASAAVAILDHLDQNDPGWGGEGAKVVTTAPTDRQVRDILWAEVRKWHNPRLHPEWILLPTDARIKTPYPDHFAVGFATVDMDRFEGWHSPHLLVVVDEAKGIPEQIFDAIMGAMTQEGARLILISTPGQPSGTYYNAFTEGSGYYKLHFKSTESAIVDQVWLQEMNDTYGKDHPLYARKVLGEFSQLVERPYFSAATIRDARAAYGTRLDPVGYHTFGVDWGKHQSYTAIVEMVGPVVLPTIKLYQPDSYMDPIDHIVRRHRQYPFIAGCGDLGAGEGQIDRLVQLGIPVQGRRMTGPYKVSAYSRLKVRFQAGTIALPPHQWPEHPDWNLEAQLIRFEESESASGNLMLHCPDGGYDDIADALVLCVDAQEGAAKEAVTVTGFASRSQRGRQGWVKGRY